MSSKKQSAENTTITRNLVDIDRKTGNLYESIVVIAKRANQINTDLKEEINDKLAEFSSSNDNLEEIFENREQIEMSRHYEKMPKPSLSAISEFMEDKLHFRNPAREVNTEE